MQDWRRFRTSFRRMDIRIFWRLGFRQSSFRHIARIAWRVVPDVWTRPPLFWHAAVPVTFRIKVSHPIQEQSSKFLLIPSGIQQSASRRRQGRSQGEVPVLQALFPVTPLRTRRTSFPVTGSPVTITWLSHAGQSAPSRRYASRAPPGLNVSSHLAPFAL